MEQLAQRIKIRSILQFVVQFVSFSIRCAIRCAKKNFRQGASPLYPQMFEESNNQAHCQERTTRT